MDYSVKTAGEVEPLLDESGSNVKERGLNAGDIELSS